MQGPRPPDINDMGTLVWKSLLMERHHDETAKKCIHQVPFTGAAFMAIGKKLFYELGEFDYGMRIFGQLSQLSYYKYHGPLFEIQFGISSIAISSVITQDRNMAKVSHRKIHFFLLSPTTLLFGSK